MSNTPAFNRIRGLARAGFGAAVLALAIGVPAPASAEGAERTRMRLADASPQKTYLDSGRKARFDFELAGTKRRDLVVKAIKLSDGKTKRRWRLKGVEPKETQTVTWNGRTSRGGYTGQGKHVFKVFEAGGDRTDMSDAEGKKRFRFYKHRFPIRARHTYGDGWGAGRNHRGVDVFARCGKRLRAVRGGKVQVKGRHGSAGRYLVIDGHGTAQDYVYMHMKPGGRPSVGERVRTGERIGYVGETGNASGCHLHFEIWTGPGWYEGGSPVRSVKRRVQRWDSWS